MRAVICLTDWRDDSTMQACVGCTWESPPEVSVTLHNERRSKECRLNRRKLSQRENGEGQWCGGPH